MLDHHIQRSIVYQLAFIPHARFSELKPDDIENKLFTYHLKKVVSAGYVIKDDDGSYSLTATGRKLGFQAINSEYSLFNKAYSILFLVVRRKTDSAWLLYSRSTHPLLGYTVFPQATPDAVLDAGTTASRDLLVKTGLRGEFRPLGGGYFHIYEKDELESFTNFSLLICDDAIGELLQQDPNGTYDWVDSPDFLDPSMFPSMPLLAELYKQNKPFFLEKTFKI
jgi:hypothetical protein